jgi:segregation and condensation protein A
MTEEELPAFLERNNTSFVLSMKDYEGPLDVLLDLSRKGRFDLMHLPICELADQYLNFIRHAQNIKLELATDYLVMAAWLTWLKSRLLIPNNDEEEEIEPQEQLEQLQIRLRHLQSIRNSAEALSKYPRLHRDFFSHKSEEKPEIQDMVSYRPQLYDLLRCYGRVQSKNTPGALTVSFTELHAPEHALEWLQDVVGTLHHWTELSQFLPDQEKQKDPLIRRSAYAGLVCAMLELTRQGKLELSQKNNYSPLMIKDKEEA